MTQQDMEDGVFTAEQYEQMHREERENDQN
jgi:hypothetical protein